MGKKVIVILLAIVSCIVLCASLALHAQNITLPDPPQVDGDMDSVNRCRCKDGGCYGGNAISFRASCAKAEYPIKCNDYKSNCK